MIQSTNPYTHEPLFEFPELDREALDRKLELAQKTFRRWRLSPFPERAERMRSAAKVLEENKALYAETITREMGKPIGQSMAEIEKCAWVCNYYADHASDQLKDEFIGTDAGQSYVKYEPLGVVLAVMPWNYPFWQVFRFAAPNLMAGNVGLLKHASNVMKCAEYIEEVFEKAGLPTGSFQNLVIKSDKVRGILENDIVKAVTLTGSAPAGSAVASIAGENIKKSVLELGGSNALIVFEDAEMEATLDTCVQARFQNTGQSCIAGKRLLVHERIADDFIPKLVRKVQELKSGDPMEEETDIGVMAREDLAKELEKQLLKSVDMGAHVLLGGHRRQTYFEPTVVTEVTPGMPLFREETFGPVLGITTFSTDKEAVALSNNSDFGLGVSLFTKDRARAEKLVPMLDEGAVFVNELVKSDPRLPFGGIKTSGYGRELSAHGIREFVNKKTVYFK